MRKSAIALSAVFASLFSVATPVVSDVTMTQEGYTVTINYTLSSEAGIVTVDIQTNATGGAWASIGGEHLTHFSGDVNKLVETGPRTMTWKPREAWPENALKLNAKAVVTAWAKSAPPDYMVASLTVPNSVAFYACKESIPDGVTNDLYKTEYLVMRKCPAANVTWRMGSPSTETGRSSWREAPHLVTISADYYIGVYPVTQRQYELIMTSGTTSYNVKPSNFKNPDYYATRSVENVSYNTLRGSTNESENINWPTTGSTVKSGTFFSLLRVFTGLGGFDLPTEVQWEFACRAGCGTALFNGQDLEDGDTSERLNLLARYARNGGFPGGDSNVEPANGCAPDLGSPKVGSYQPNDWGIYDMLGNMWEWCLDWYQHTAPTGTDALIGPTECSENTGRVCRGGSWRNGASNCRCAERQGLDPTSSWSSIGFRVACPAAIP